MRQIDRIAQAVSAYFPISAENWGATQFRHRSAQSGPFPLAGPPPSSPARNQPAPPRLTPLGDSLLACLESGFPGGIVTGGLLRLWSIPWHPAPTGRAF